MHNVQPDNEPPYTENLPRKQEGLLHRGNRLLKRDDLIHQICLRVQVDPSSDEGAHRSSGCQVQSMPLRWHQQHPNRAKQKGIATVQGVPRRRPALSLRIRAPIAVFSNDAGAIFHPVDHLSRRFHPFHEFQPPLALPREPSSVLDRKRRVRVHALERELVMPRKDLIKGGKIAPVMQIRQRTLFAVSEAANTGLTADPGGRA